MLDALLKILEPYGYTSLYHYNPERMDAIVRTQMNSAGGRLFIAQHNRVTRLHAPGKRVVIADTFLDGYKQITSFCRYVRKVETCDGRMVQCMKGRFALAQNEYRWAGREGESWDVYIDMPLSSEYPALSTSVVRNTFPGAHLDIKQYNVANSSCPELKGLRDVYTRYYAKLEKQISRLRYRMLYLTGYSSVAAPGENVNVVEMLEAAEILEQEKYGVGSGKGEADASYSERHRQLIENVPKWQKIDGKVILGKVKAT